MIFYKPNHSQSFTNSESGKTRLKKIVRIPIPDAAIAGNSSVKTMSDIENGKATL
jgi:hypothetical protein